MDDELARKNGWLNDEELKEREHRLTKTEEEGLKNTLKHFDRIHDKLFTFNNILIAGYFALSKITNDTPLLTILIPIFNLAILLFIEYKMMTKSRFEASISKKTEVEVDKWGSGTNGTNRYSLFAIISTAVVTLIFLTFLVLY